MFRSLLTRTRAVARAQLQPQLKMQQQQQQQRGVASAKLYVKGLPLDMDDAGVREVFEPYGNIYQVQFVQPRPGFVDKAGFVQMYVGDLPATVEELANMPPPPQSEIEELQEVCRKAMDALAGQRLGPNPLAIEFAIRNAPDNIQFDARMKLRRERDPAWAARNPRPAGAFAAAPAQAAQATQGSYADGYRAGFKDGIEHASKRS